MSSLSKNEKVFKHFLDVPEEVRMMFIEEMKAKDRCRFTRCSKLSNEEAKRSKNYIYALNFEAFFNFNFDIVVIHSKEDFVSYILNYFVDERDKKYMTYSDMDITEYWREGLNDSTDLVLYAAEKFKELLRIYQSKIKVLGLVGSMFNKKELKNYDFGIENLKNLEELRINGNTESIHLLSKLRRPLKELHVQIVENDQVLTDCEQVYQVQNTLIMPNTKFTKDQFLQISAFNVHINIGDLTEMDIFHFIRSWQNGTINKEVRLHSWNRPKDSDFDMIKLLRLLGVDDLDAQNMTRTNFKVEIKHFKKPKSCAKLRYIESDEENDEEEVNQLIFKAEYEGNCNIEGFL